MRCEKRAARKRTTNDERVVTMLITTLSEINEEDCKIIGLVRGSAAFSKNAVKDLGQAFKSVVGGELKSYSDLLEMAADAATQKMEQQADEMDADAIVGVNYSSMSMADGAAAVMVSGTAVKFV